MLLEWLSYTRISVGNETKRSCKMDEDKTRYICNKVKQIGKMKGNIRRLRWIHRVNAGVYYTPRVRYHISYSVVRCMVHDIQTQLQ